MRTITLLLPMCALLLAPASAPTSRSVIVRHREGTLHGFLAGRAADGTLLAQGDLVQAVVGDRVTNDLTFHFLDGSVQQETVVFEQRQRFRVISDRLTQHGKTFPKQVDWVFDAATGHVRTTSTDEHGAPESADTRVDIVPDLANGLVPTLLQNTLPADLPLKVPFLAPSPDARRVMLEISADGEERCVIVGVPRMVTRYLVHVSIGGLAGFIAPIVGKEPPDSHVWILQGTAPAFMKSETPLYDNGPMFRIELASPTWPSAKGQ